MRCCSILGDDWRVLVGGEFYWKCGAENGEKCEQFDSFALMRCYSWGGGSVVGRIGMQRRFEDDNFLQTIWCGECQRQVCCFVVESELYRALTALGRKS
jgi:hypothetical protein